MSPLPDSRPSATPRTDPSDAPTGRGAGSPASGEASLREAVLALARWQCATPVAGLAPLDDAALRAELALFAHGCGQPDQGPRWTDAQQRAWAQVCDRLVASALAQPQLAVHGDWTPQRLQALADPGGAGLPAMWRGPVTYDLAGLLRSADLGADEAQQLDLGVRWWQQARREGVPLGDTLAEDFGECWRALEWMGLLRQLADWGRLDPAARSDGAAAGRGTGLLQEATRVALRYAPLKPLLGLLAPMTGQRLDRGFTF